MEASTSAMPTTIATAESKDRGRPPLVTAVAKSAEAVVARNTHAPGFSRTANTPFRNGVDPDLDAAGPSSLGRIAGRKASHASSSRNPPPTTFSTRRAVSPGTSTDSPAASTSSSRPNVPFAPAIAVNPRRMPPRVASVSSSNWTGPGRSPSAAPRPKALARMPTCTCPSGTSGEHAALGTQDAEHPIGGGFHTDVCHGRHGAILHEDDWTPGRFDLRGSGRLSLAASS